jgi:UDP-N-acetylglucosamine--N-acetylmuramyl-(pentapeptide) pyrophosphoryl-undecaprenol N-acetylglucosamine transferase
MKQPLIACVAGKSGGHIVPCLSYAHESKQHDESIIFFSNNTPLDHHLIKNEKEISVHIPMVLRSYTGFFGLFKTMYHLISAFATAYTTLRAHRPRMVISTGGIESFPVCVAAWLLTIPTTLFELNAVPGKAARWCAPFATRVCVCFKDAATYFNATKTEYVAYPLQESIKNITPVSTHLADKKTILILGGSQGSVTLNTIIKNYIDANLSAAQQNLHIIHQTGNNDTTNWTKWYQERNISAEHFPFINDLTSSYQKADLIIARAGAGTLFEIAHLQKKAIIIPLETATTDHQKDNAHAMSREHPELFTVLWEREIQHDPATFKNALARSS